MNDHLHMTYILMLKNGFKGKSRKLPNKPKYRVNIKTPLSYALDIEATEMDGMYTTMRAILEPR